MPLRPLLTHALLVGLVTPALLVGFARPTSAASVDGERAQLPTRRAVAEGTPARAMPARINAMMTRADTVPVRADTVREYRGVYETGFEVSWFHPCDGPPSDDTWWVTLTNEALRQRDSLARALTGKPSAVLVRWRATVGPKMPMGAGHMGRGSRYMLVTKVLSLSASDRAGCTSA